MQNVRRFLAITIGAVLGVAVLILLGINLYVQSQGTQAKIEQELSQRLGTTLHLRRLSVTPWGGLKLSGITIPQSQPGPPGYFLQAKTFRLRIQFRSLFSRRLVIKEVSLINPDVVWPQNADGKWRLPSVPPEARKPQPPPLPEIAPPPLAKTAAPSAAPPTAASVAVSVPTTSPASLTPEIRRVNLVGGRFRFLDAKSNSVATFDNVIFHSAFRQETELRGNISIAKTSLRNRFFLEQLQSPLRYDPTEMDFSAITARAGGGEITGRFTLQPQAEDSPFIAIVKFRELQADRIVSDAGGAAGTITGRLDGFLDAAGKTADPNALTGKGEINLRDGRVQYSLLVALGQLLQIDELRDLQLEQAEVKYHISPGVVTIDELIFRSSNIRLSATGTVSFSGKLRLESQLAVNDQLRGRLFGAIRENFAPSNEPGYSAISFQVNGTVDRPKTNLMDKLVGRDLKDLGSVLNSLIGGRKSERPGKKKSSSGAPAPSATASPGGVDDQSSAPNPSPADAPQPSASP